jgi:mono/diheme cytochrome c family protein
MIGAPGCKSASSAEAEAFDRNCGACHAVANLPGARAQGLADPQKRMALDRFLAQHHAPDAAERGQVIDYLTTQEN